VFLTVGIASPRPAGFERLPCNKEQGMIEAKQYYLKPDQPIPSIFKVMIEDARRPRSPEEEKAKREFLLGQSSLKDFFEARLRVDKPRSRTAL
jgi:hypothetical protein